MLFIRETQPPQVLNNISLRLLATLGDAVTNLFEKERVIFHTSSAKTLHNQAQGRVNAKAQSQFLEQLTAKLTEKELDLVRRARNLKTTRHRKIEQAIYRQATAFEVLIGYLYLSDPKRLRELLELLDMLTIED